MGRLLPFFIVGNIILTAAALISCLSTEDEDVRRLPRIVWVIIILLFPPIGSIAWFVAGRPRRGAGAKQAWRPGGGFPESQRPGKTVAPDDDPDFLKRLDRNRAEQEAAEMMESERDMLRKWEDDLRRRESELRDKDKPDEA